MVFNGVNRLQLENTMNQIKKLARKANENKGIILTAVVTAIAVNVVKDRAYNSSAPAES